MRGEGLWVHFLVEAGARMGGGGGAEADFFALTACVLGGARASMRQLNEDNHE